MAWPTVEFARSSRIVSRPHCHGGGSAFVTLEGTTPPLKRFSQSSIGIFGWSTS